MASGLTWFLPTVTVLLLVRVMCSTLVNTGNRSRDTTPTIEPDDVDITSFVGRVACLCRVLPHVTARPTDNDGDNADGGGTVTAPVKISFHVAVAVVYVPLRCVRVCACVRACVRA